MHTTSGTYAVTGDMRLNNTQAFVLSFVWEANET